MLLIQIFLFHRLNVKRLYVTSTVSIIRCKNYDRDLIYDKVRESVNLLGGMDSFVKPGEKVLIKPNLLKARPPEAAVTTHPEVVRAVIRLVRQAGGTPVVGDSPGMGEEEEVLRHTGILGVMEDEETSIADFTDSVKIRGMGRFHHFEVAKSAEEADAIINLPKFKTHGMMVMTGAVKNLFGCVPGKKKVQWHFNTGIDHESFARMLVELSVLLKPRLTILDAVTAMEGNGPGSGDPCTIGLIIAGEDTVALDVVSSIIVGLSPMQLPVIRAARSAGIGESRIDQIRILGEDINDIMVKDFRIPQLTSTEWPVPEWARCRLKDALTTRPVINHNECVRCRICQKDCPRGAIKESGGRLKIDYRNCIRCFCCQEFCPEGAITVGKGWMLRLAGLIPVHP
jgi:uncharacterized protein (DUF362 family)/Pyruvate/2-oxoacid:ferredoxin oxidoreductase delta subunit